MAGVRALITLAFTGALGLLFLILACALPRFSNWAPFWVIVFYILLPIPNLLARRHKHESDAKDLANFLTAGIVVSAFALPIVMSRAPVVSTQDIITPVTAGDLDVMTTSPSAPLVRITGYVISGGACFLTLLSNTVMIITILGFFKIFDDDDDLSFI